MAFPFQLPLLLDGATGTNLYAAGMPRGVCVEQWAAEHPEVVAALQRAYAQAGSNAVYTPSFCANSISLARHGLAERMRPLNLELAALTRGAVGPGVLVGGDMASTGEFCEPFGEGRFLDHITAYAEQALALRDGGVDFIVAETIMSLSEARAALMGAWQSRLPVIVSITVDERGRTLSGTDPLAALVALQAMGAAAFGLNCSCGAQAMAEHIARLAPYARVPLIAKPNAGLPDAETGEYRQTPDEMASEMRALLAAGAQLVGGCCGSTPAHIAAIAGVLRDFRFDKIAIEHDFDSIMLCNETDVFFLDEDYELSDPIKCALDMTDDLMAAADEGCDALSIHVGSNEDAHCFSQNAHMARLPVSFLAENEEALEEALIYYNGRAIIDSRSGVERERLEELAAGYGAVLR